MKPNFSEMSRDELRAYVLDHRDDLEAMRLFFNVPPKNDVKRYPSMFDDDGQPIEANIRIMEEAIRQKVEESRRNT